MELFRRLPCHRRRSQRLVVRIRIQPWGGENYYLPFEEETYTAYVGNNPRTDREAPSLRLHVTNHARAVSTIDYDFAAGEKTVRKEREVLGGYDKSKYEA